MEKKLVLIIEDDPDARMMYSECLKIEGFETEEAGTAKEADAYCTPVEEKRRPDAILLDLSIPFFKTDEFMGRVQSSPWLSGIPVIILSGWDDIASRAKTLGAHAYIRKPCGVETLVTTIRKFVSRGDAPLMGKRLA